MSSLGSPTGASAGEPVSSWKQCCVFPIREVFPENHQEENKPLKYACCPPLVFKKCGLHLGYSLMLVLPWFQLPFSPAIIQAEAEQLLGLCHPHILSVTLLQDIMYRGAPTTPPRSYLHSQLWTRELRGKAICLSLLIGVAAKPPSTRRRALTVAEFY